MVRINQRGITLIALVITIIVLLILAGVTINILLGQDGIINRTQQAKEQHEYAAAKEIIDLKLAEIYTDAVSNNEEYTMKKITTEMDKDTTITTEQKYFNTTASLKSGVSGSVDNLKGIVVSANQYSRFKFLVSGVNGSIQVIGYTTETIPNTWTTGDLPTGFIAIGESKQATPPGATTYTVTFKDGETTLSTATVEEGKTATRPTDPTKAGFDFVNWYSDSELTTEFDFSTDITANTEIYAKWELAQQTWSQDGINVTDGIITLKVGSAVTGYTGGGLGDGNWYVLGAKDGKLLITTTANVGNTIQLIGQTGYANGISILNTAASSYLNSNLADESRSINVDDINRVTKYDPDSAACYSGNIYAYGNQVKYTLNSIDGKIHYQGATESYLPASDTSSSYESFTYWTGSVWKSLLSGENTTLTSNTYCYYPANLTATYNTECFIKDQNDSEPAFELLFHNGTGSNESYWLGSTYIEARKGKLYLRITKRQCC